MTSNAAIDEDAPQNRLALEQLQQRKAMNTVSLINYLFVVCIFLYVSYDFFQRQLFQGRWPPLNSEAKLDLILVLLGAYVLTATLRLDQIDRGMRNALPTPVNQFDQALRDFSSSLENGIRSKQITFSNHYESMAALLRAIDNSTKSYEALNFYTSGWDGEMHEVYSASVAAVRRKVHVWRCFVVRANYRPGELDKQIEAMARQHDEGVDVFWVAESDLRKMPFFRENPARSMALVDGEVLLIDTSPADRAASPNETRITWVPGEVARNPFTQLKSYEYIKPFDELAIREFVKRSVGNGGDS